MISHSIFGKANKSQSVPHGTSHVETVSFYFKTNFNEILRLRSSSVDAQIHIPEFVAQPRFQVPCRCVVGGISPESEARWNSPPSGKSKMVRGQVL